MSVRPPPTRPVGQPAPDAPDARPPWYRRRAVLVTGAVVVVVALTVLSDIPVHSSRAQEVAAERAVMHEINADISSCALAAREAFGVRAEQVSGSMPASDRAAAPGLLRDDQQACSFTNDSIYQLSNIEVPGSPAGRHLGALVATATLWVTADALGAIEDIQTLQSHPGDTQARRDLARKEGQLAADRQRALAETAAARGVLRATLPAPDLPALSSTGP